MYIFVEALTGLKIRIKVIPEDTIQNIKHRIMICEDLPIDEQHLIYQDKDLENHRTLSYYRIGNDATIRLIMKMKGGPLSVDTDYEELFSETVTNSLTDQLAIIFLENGELRFLPILGLEMQSKMIKQTKEDLNDPSIFSPYEEPLNDQKLTILKLKMDCIRLGKKMSNMSRHQENEKPISMDGENQQTKSTKPLNSILHRSVSLDSRPSEFISEISNSTSKFKGHHYSLHSQRQPSNGIYRTTSVVDTIRTNKNLMSNFPPIQNSLNSRHRSNVYFREKKESLLDSKTELRQRLPPLNESEYENKKPIPRKPRCPVCLKKMSIANEFVCRCGGHYCSKHKYPEEHSCRFDYKYNGRLELMKSNPIIESKKIAKI